MQSFLWYDLETFGKDPRRTRIVQFAAIRTDAELNPLDEPCVLWCQPADDLLPSPAATLITGITPQQAQREGMPEADFIGRVHELLAQPGTCAVGYNSLRFDDEFIRFGLFRNFHDPYAREWARGNSRWDLLEYLRLAYAMRPDGLQWPRRDDGFASFKLVDLAAANGVSHQHAHDALSDVQALIGLARLAQRAQPKLWDYALTLRNKRSAAAHIDVTAQIPLLHVSGRFPASRRHAALVLPIARHPHIDSRIIAFDLAQDPGQLLALDADDIADRLYTPAADLPDGEQRIALKEIHLNRCPSLVPLEFVRDADCARLGIDMQSSLANAELIRRASGLPETLRRVFARSSGFAPGDVDASLYDGFIADADRRHCERVRATPPERLGHEHFAFADPRLGELLFRYRARNWPDTLDADERARWDDYRRQRLQTDIGWSEYTFASHAAEIAQLRQHHAGDGRAQTLLDALQAWAAQLQAGL
ncbi:MAG: exodeoxyribonuclease I [Lysobacterales bacterium CG17_big_fil_post_rev_8_21_14_2_50_64_11]|nr:MAG: exodeoxyribonuclease I [Xanthomonadales bacterium CG17_big_fil_post_rev_8_21_14_2_50_64_11]PIX59749.1 MAG: exodeoxyribonuclease I [Xanthomonadales bacterium CG_4_10_14_3_um_filter_64_11]